MFGWYVVKNPNGNGIRFIRRRTINVQAESYGVVFAGDGKHILNGGKDGKIRRWRVQDGREVGEPMSNAGGEICSIAVSGDGKWVLSGTVNGFVTVWDTASGHKVTECKGHSKRVGAVAIAPDGETIASGSNDKTVRVWSRSTGEQIHAWKHVSWLAAVKYSPNGRFIATATHCYFTLNQAGSESTRVYSVNGDRILDASIGVVSSCSNTIAWASDSRQLFVLSHGGEIVHLKVLLDGTTLQVARWNTAPRDSIPQCIALAGNGKFVILSSRTGTFFLDMATYKQVGSVVQHSSSYLVAMDMTISAGFDLAITGHQKITVFSLQDILPSSYFETISSPSTRPIEVEQPDKETTHSLRPQITESPNGNARPTAQFSDTHRKIDSLTRMEPIQEEKHLSMLGSSPDLPIRKQSVDAISAIQHAISESILRMPHILIDTTTGRLCNKTQLAAAFKKHSKYDELRRSMITQLDIDRIRKEVQEFYRYVMFSHRWEDHGEPLFRDVVHISIDELKPTSPNIKLQELRKLARSLGFRWVWSDTCCIDKDSTVVLQESLVAMYAWYRGSSLTIVHLLGVLSKFQTPDALRRSIWNTRAWTYQEYIAAEVVQFYTEDWKPYLGLDMFNHKESPAIVLEMEQVSYAAQTLAALRPGFENIREKLLLASSRQATRVEDIAYSLLGIFNVSIPVIYGEGNRAVGRLLDHIISRSGDVTTLAWTGRAGDYNSCLPRTLKVYGKLVPPHIPQPLEAARIDRRIAALCSLSPNTTSLALDLHKALSELPSVSFVASRLQLPGIVFPINLIAPPESDPHSQSRIYLATPTALGDVAIETSDDLSGKKGMLLIHPWISALLDQEHSQGAGEFDPITRALRLVVRLTTQPFGGLLLAPVSRTQYRRVAADCLILAQVRADAPLGDLIANVRRAVDIQ